MCDLISIKNNIINIELYTIHLLQKYIHPYYIFILVSYIKYLTSFNSISVYLSIALYYDIYLFMYIVFALCISRKTNYYIKNYYKKQRPYNRNPEYITYYKKRKYSYSFPSQSILNISIIYNTIYYYNLYKFSYNKYIWYECISYIYYILFVLLSITRMFRGLHYPHDIIISYLYSIFIVKLIFFF